MDIKFDTLSQFDMWRYFETQMRVCQKRYDNYTANGKYFPGTIEQIFFNDYVDIYPDFLSLPNQIKDGYKYLNIKKKKSKGKK